MIQATNLTKTFGEGTKEVKAIDHISFEVAEGQLFTLLGPSGCGKTTTLRCIAGLENPSQGEITIGNQAVFSDSKGILVPANKRSIGMVFSRSSPVVFWFLTTMFLKKVILVPVSPRLTLLPSS